MSASYKEPSDILKRLFLPPKDPSLTLSSDYEWLVITSEPPLPSIELLAKPEGMISFLQYFVVFAIISLLLSLGSQKNLLVLDLILHYSHHQDWIMLNHWYCNIWQPVNSRVLNYLPIQRVFDTFDSILPNRTLYSHPK